MTSVHRWWAALLALLSIGYACTKLQPAQIAMPQPGPRFVDWNGNPDELWGVADLHAHPAAQLAFGGLNGKAGLLWGDVGLPGTLTAVPGGDLPSLLPCDPGTHESRVNDQVSRLTRDLVFSQLTRIANYPHTPHGRAAPDEDQSRSYESWPNARDILHQTMNIQSIRRAYEGGLRLMFASTVESQVIAFAMHTTIFPSFFAPTRAQERASAEAQLILIRDLVSANSDWMEVAATPDQAEDAIRQDRLAVVLALENDGLLLDDVRDLVAKYGVGAIVPVHLVDNDVGGTAAYTDLFNAGTRLEGTMFGYPDRYISVEADPTLRFHLGWPEELAQKAGAYTIQPIGYAAAAPLGYNQYPECSPNADGIPNGTGSRNSVGLRQPQTIQALMAMGLYIDVAHMGYRSTEETVELARATCSYALVDTHTGFHVKGRIGGSERDLFEDHAHYIADSGGVVGLGTTGRSTQTPCSTDGLDPSTMASARGAPLAHFSGGQLNERVIIQFPGDGLACDMPFGSNATSVGVGVVSPSLPPGGKLYAKINFEGGVQQQIEVGQLGNGNISPLLPLKSGHDMSQVVSIVVGLLDPSSCDYTGLPGFDIQSVTIVDDTGDSRSIDRSRLGTQVGQAAGPLATFTGSAGLSIGSRSEITAYMRCRTDTTLCDPSATFLHPKKEPLSHLRVRITSGTRSLQSASSMITGAKVTGSFCQDPNCSGDRDPCTNPEFVVTPAGGWPNGVEMDQYVPFAGDDVVSSVKAIGLCLAEHDLTGEPWEIDEIDIDRVDDPTRQWTADYAYYLQQMFAGRKGALALGTDSDGLSPQFAFTDFVPGYASDAKGCVGGDATAAMYGDPATGGTFTLQRPLSVDGTSLCLPERGLAVYGMFPEFFAAVYHYDPQVYGSLFRSAKATIDAWRASRKAAAAYATSPSTCNALDLDAATPLDGAGQDAGVDAAFDTMAGDR